MLISQCQFDEPAKANGLPEVHGSPKVHGPCPGVIVPPCPPSRRPWEVVTEAHYKPTYKLLSK